MTSDNILMHFHIDMYFDIDPLIHEETYQTCNDTLYFPLGDIDNVLLFLIVI
jgi:hypothetical protein